MEDSCWPKWIVRRGAAWAFLTVVGFCRPAAAQPPEQSTGKHSAALVPPLGTYIHLFATAALGDSIRFNNPYRLSNQLGDSGQSLSRTPVYANVGGAFAFGDPDGWQHGGALHWSRALAGLPQHVLTPAYLLHHGGLRPWLPYARAGFPIVLNPDANVGGELAVGGAYLLTAGLGIHAEIIGNVFYGAATWETGVTTIPMLSFQAGIFADYEVLP